MLETLSLPDRGKTLGEFGYAGDDHVVPFEVGPLDARGRIVQIGPLLDDILGRHDYPEPVAQLVAEACVVAILLGSSLKFDGKFILQTRTDGPVDMLVADFTTPGSLRAYARFDDERLAALTDAGEIGPATLIGSGILALTIDQGEHMQRYQGIVELDGTTLEDAARTYFRQSEQIPTEIKLEVAKLLRRGSNGPEQHWRAGGLIAQFLPDSPERLRVPDLPGGDGAPEIEPTVEIDNAWLEVQALLGTIEPAELIDPMIESERLLYRLFHEHGVRVFPGVRVADECSCSPDRIRGILAGFTAEEIAQSTESGKIKVSCEFCSTDYEFDPSEFSPER